jgi:hypothetical protein
LPGGTFNNGIRVAVRRNETTYLYPAGIDDLIDVYSRVSCISNSSFCFRHVLINTERINFYAVINLFRLTLIMKPTYTNDSLNKYRKLIEKFEGKDLEIIRD